MTNPSLGDWLPDWILENDFLYSAWVQLMNNPFDDAPILLMAEWIEDNTELGLMNPIAMSLRRHIEIASPMPLRNPDFSGCQCGVPNAKPPCDWCIDPEKTEEFWDEKFREDRLHHEIKVQREQAEAWVNSGFELDPYLHVGNIRFGGDQNVKMAIVLNKQSPRTLVVCFMPPNNNVLEMKICRGFPTVFKMTYTFFTCHYKRLFFTYPITNLKITDPPIHNSGGNSTCYLGNLGFFESKYWHLLDNQRTHMDLRRNLEQVCIAAGREAVGLPPINWKMGKRFGYENINKVFLEESSYVAFD